MTGVLTRREKFRDAEETQRGEGRVVTRAERAVIQPQA